MPVSNTYNMDCLNWMSHVADKAFDLAIVDPPYGIKESAHRNLSRSKLAKTRMYKVEFWDHKVPTAEYFSELFRISKNQIIWGGNYFLDHLPATRCFIVWDKMNAGTNFADCELAWTSFKSSVRKFSFLWNGMMQGEPGNGTKMNPHKKFNEVRIHPTQKPVALYKWLLTNYAKDGDKILDTHLGSQSSRIAAYDLGFEFHGAELDADYFKAGNERFERHIKQASLFEPVPTVSQIGLF